MSPEENPLRPDPIAQQRIPLADLNARLSRAEALDTYCPDCGARPGHACVFLPITDLMRPGTTSKKVLARRAKIGQATAKPHNGRHATEVQRLAAWLYAWGSTLVVPELAERDEHARCLKCGEALSVHHRDLQVADFHTSADFRSARRSYWRHLSGGYGCGVGFPMTPRPLPGLAIDTMSREEIQ